MCRGINMSGQCLNHGRGVRLPPAASTVVLGCPWASSPSLMCFEKALVPGPCPACVGFRLSLLRPCRCRLPSFCLLRFVFSLMAAFVSLLPWELLCRGAVSQGQPTFSSYQLLAGPCRAPVCVCHWRGCGDSPCRGAARCRAAPGPAAEGAVPCPGTGATCMFLATSPAPGCHPRGGVCA